MLFQAYGPYGLSEILCNCSAKTVTDNWSINEYDCINIKIGISYNYHVTKYGFDCIGIAWLGVYILSLKNQIAFLKDFTNFL